MKNALLAVFVTIASSLTAPVALAADPNIVVILTDDQGYADISLNPHHPQEVSTPNMDALAKAGVVFSQGYTSGHVCSPTRAGIMIGGYQQRVGIYTAGDGGRGFDPKQKIFPAFLPDEYVSTAIGKWHLGLDDDYPELKWHALNRGFDECYKFMGRGAHSYFNLRSDQDGKFAGAIYRNKERINDEGYLTNRLSEEAVAFIDRNKSKPFFLYLAYNAVHAPAEAPAADIKAYRAKFPNISQERAILMAMLKHLDATGLTPREIERAKIREQRRQAKLDAKKAAKEPKQQNEKAKTEPAAATETLAENADPPTVAANGPAADEPATAQSPAPATAFDLSHWKLTLPTDAARTYDGHATEISATQLAAGFKDSHFHCDADGSMVFWCPVGGATTEGTEFPRSELREMLKPGDPSVNWTAKGAHRLAARCRVVEVPSNPKVVIGQIHSYLGKANLLFQGGRVSAG